MEKGREATIFETVDLNLVAFLVATLGVQFGVVFPDTGSNKLRFCIIDSKDIHEAVNRFSSNAPVGIQNYIQAMESVKDRLMDIKRALKSDRRVDAAQTTPGK